MAQVKLNKVMKAAQAYGKAISFEKRARLLTAEVNTLVLTLTPAELDVYNKLTGTLDGLDVADETDTTDESEE